VPTSSDGLLDLRGFVTSSASGVTRFQVLQCTARPRITLFAPRLSASSTRARPMPRFAPGDQDCLVLDVHTVLLRSLSFLLAITHRLLGRIRPTGRFRCYPVSASEVAPQRSRPCGIVLPSGTCLRVERDCPSHLGQRILDGNGFDCATVAIL